MWYPQRAQTSVSQERQVYYRAEINLFRFARKKSLFAQMCGCSSSSTVSVLNLWYMALCIMYIKEKNDKSLLYVGNNINCY